MAQKGRNLSDMYAGQQATLKTIQGSKALCDRLTALGFWKEHAYAAWGLVHLEIRSPMRCGIP